MVKWRNSEIIIIYHIHPQSKKQISTKKISPSCYFAISLFILG
jgi:proteasome lid subunit RPN8/RPN11